MGKLTLNTVKIIIIVVRSKLQNEANIHIGWMIQTRTTLLIHNFKTTSQTLQFKLKMVIPSLSSLKIPAIEIHRSYRDTLWNKLEINSHTKIEIAVKCKSKPIRIVNKWQKLQNKHKVNNKTEINSHAKIEIAIECNYKIIQIVHALWLAIKPFYMSVCKHGFCSSFISYFIKEM